MKKILLVLVVIMTILSAGLSTTFAVNSAPNANDIEIGNPDSGNSVNNNYLQQLGKNGDGDIKIGNEGEKSIVEFLYTIAKDLKAIVYIISGVYFLIITLKLIVSNNTDEEVSKFKKGIIWITIGIILMQIVYFYVEISYAQEVGANLARNLTENLIHPIIKVLETAASFFFLLIAIYAFYRIVTANGNDDKVKEGKMTIVYGLIGFIVIKLSKDLVYSSYGQVSCNDGTLLGIFDIKGNSCVTDNQISGIGNIVVQIINWANSFVGIIVILMIIYAGIQVLFSGGDEEKLTKAKKSIIYIAIGIALLVLNFFILTFFIKPEVAITI